MECTSGVRYNHSAGDHALRSIKKEQTALWAWQEEEDVSVHDLRKKRKDLNKDCM